MHDLVAGVDRLFLDRPDLHRGVETRRAEERVGAGRCGVTAGHGERLHRGNVGRPLNPVVGEPDGHVPLGGRVDGIDDLLAQRPVKQPEVVDGDVDTRPGAVDEVGDELSHLECLGLDRRQFRLVQRQGPVQGHCGLGKKYGWILPVAVPAVNMIPPFFTLRRHGVL